MRPEASGVNNTASGVASTELCRVTVVAPRMRLDVAVPHEVPLAHLLPTLLWHSGEQLAEEGVPHGGWALQRAGEGPLDSGLTMAALGVRDGDILYLRTRATAAPAPVFDDTADAITATLRERARRWDHADSRVAAFGAIGGLLVAGAFALAVSGGAVGLAGAGGSAAGVNHSAAGKVVIALVAACVAAAALLGATAAARAFADSALAAVFALGGLPYAFVAGLLALPGLTGPAAGGVKTATGPAFLVGSTVFVIAAALGVAAIGQAASIVTGALAAGFVAVAGGLVAVATSAAGGAAAVVSLALIATPVIAPIAYRVARLPKPLVPASSEELRQRSEPPDFADVPSRTVVADRVVSALVAATAVVTVAAVAIMLRQPGWAAPTLAALASGLLLLRARLFAGIGPKSWLIGSGLLSLMLLIGAGAGRWPMAGAVAVGVGVASASAVLAWTAAVPRRPSPPLARLVDLAELIATIATVPVALDVLGVFHAVRVLGG